MVILCYILTILKMAPASGGIPVVSIFYFFYFLGKVNTTSVASFLYNIRLIYEKKLCRRDHVLFTLFMFACV